MAGSGQLIQLEDGRMQWIYGERVATAKWQREEIQAQLADVVYAHWESTAVEAGCVPVDGTLTETVVPMWVQEDGTISDQAVIDVEPEQITLQVSGEVTVTEPPPPVEEPVP